MSYESSLKAQRDYYASMSYAKKEAREEGIERGVEKGQIEIAKNLIIRMGFSDQEVVNMTGMNMELVKKARRDLKGDQ